MIGDRIRRRRLELKLSQRQLAGDTISREYVSEIECGKRIPSKRVLAELANRLQTSVTALEGHSQNEEIMKLVDECERIAKSDLQTALSLALQAAEMAKGSQDPRVQFSALLNAGMMCYKMCDYEAAREHFENTLRYADDNIERRSIFTALFYLANAYYLGGEFIKAIRYYRRSLQIAEGYKTLLEDTVQASIFLGSSLFRIGDLQGSIASYSCALELAKIINHGAQIVDAALGLGWVLFQRGQVEKAIQVTETAIKFSRINDNYAENSLTHNMAIYQSAGGNYVTATRFFMKCLAKYRETQDTPNQVRVYEELGQIAIKRQNVEDARVYIDEARRLVRIVDNDVLSGRVYRLIGDLCLLQNGIVDAQTYYELAIGYFKKCKATGELNETVKRMDNSTNTNRSVR